MIYDKVDMLLMIPTSECMYCMYNYSARSRLELACRSVALQNVVIMVLSWCRCMILNVCCRRHGIGGLGV